MTKQIKICVDCGYSFSPTISDDWCRELFYTEDEIDAFDNIKRENPHWDGKLEHPKQMLCQVCALGIHKDHVPKDERISFIGTRSTKTRKRVMRLNAKND